MMPSDLVKTEIDHLNEDLERVIQNHQFILNRETQRIYDRIAQIQEECEHQFENGVCKICGLTAPEEETPIEEEPIEDASEDDGAQESEE